jgi:predicted glycosyltransferase
MRSPSSLLCGRSLISRRRSNTAVASPSIDSTLSGGQPQSADGAKRRRARRVWIDLDNTPHVPFFLPIIRSLERDGHSVLVTARDAFQVCGLAEYHGLTCHVVGRHYGANKTVKVAGTLWRALQLLPRVLRQRPDVSMSHGSRPLEIVSAVLKIPSMLIFDYEHAMRLPLVKPALGLAPEAIQDPSLGHGFKYGLRTYPGLKEDVYAATFRPEASILDELGVAADDILVTIRPPATEAHYHNPEAERLFVDVVEFLGRIPHLRMVILPRTKGTQGEFIRRQWPEWCQRGTIIVPERPLDGLNLIWFSDFVVSGGGTMNREAAALGVPVFSIFRGKLGGVDRYLAREGRLTLLETREDIWSKLRPVKRSRRIQPGGEKRALDQILSAASELMDLSRRGH